MVLWCKSCNALVGLREPFTDWSIDRNALCADCMVTEAKAYQINLEDSAIYHALESTKIEHPTLES